MGKLTTDELNKIKEIIDIEKKSKTKAKFSKKMVTLIVVMNILFTATVVFLYYRTGTEPTTLIEKWFKFTGVQLVAMAGIKISDTWKGEE